MSRRTWIRLVLCVAICSQLATSARADKAGETGKAEKTAAADTPRGARVGVGRSLRLVPDLARAVPHSGTRRSWTHTVRVEGATFLRPRFARVDLRPGDTLTVRSASGRVVEEITLRGPKARRSFWGLSAFGDQLHLELLFDRDYDQPPFVLTDVIVGDGGMLERASEGIAPAPPEHKSICATADFEDVLCYQGDTDKWANVMASVGVATANAGAGALWCSGSNISPLNHVLTNQHCIEDQVDCDSAEIIFRYYRTGCGDGAPPTADWVSYRCDEVLASSPFGPCDATSTHLDYTLASVVGDPATSFGHVTPDPTPLGDGEAIYIVQHPAGRPHEITHGSGADVDVDRSGNLSTIRYFGPLDSEIGSSGSPIFRESDDLMVGLHHCSGCSDPRAGNRGTLMSDIYPHLEAYLCQPGLALAPTTPDALVELDGNGDAVVDPGETWSFVPRLRNSSCGVTATGVVASFALAAGSAAIELLVTTSSFGTLVAGEGAAGTPIRFTVGAALPCAGDVRIDLTQVTTSLGGPFAGRPAYLQAEIGSVPTTTFLFEDFAALLPVTWSVEHGGTGAGPAATWTDADPASRNLLNAPYLIADSHHLGPGFLMDEGLISPPVDVTGAAAVTLQFEHDFNHYAGGGGEKAAIDVRSGATAGAWVNVHTFPDADDAGPRTFDLTPFAAMDLQLRFHYHDADDDWWWAIDDIYLLGDDGRRCTPVQLFADDFETGDTAAWSATQARAPG